MRFFYLIFLTALIVACDTNVAHNINENQNEDLLNITSDFQSIDENILQPLCVSCHNSASAPKNVDLSSYKKIIGNSNYPPLIYPKRPEQSSLYISLANGSMPRNAPKLSNTELQVVYDWIKNGATQ